MWLVVVERVNENTPSQLSLVWKMGESGKVLFSILEKKRPHAVL